MSVVQKMRDARPQEAKGEAQAEARAEEVRRRRQRARNWAIFLVLAAFVTIVYVVTIVKLKGAG